MRRHSLFTTHLFLLLTAFCLLPIPLRAQQPQAQAGQPIYAVNAKYVQGVGPGYWPTAGSQLTLNLAPGTVVCSNTVQTYAGGTLTLAANATNYVYLDGSNNCAPASNTTGFTGTAVPIAQVATNGTTITSITDVRTMFDWAAPSGGTLTSVAMNGDGVIYSTAVSGSPITGSGTLAPQLLTQTANKFLAGPSSGPAATPTFRVIAAADLPNIAVAGGGTGQTTPSAAFKALSPLSTEGDLIYYHSSANVRLGVGTSGQCVTSNGTDPLWGACGGGGGTVTSVGLSLPSIFSVTGSPVTTSGTLTATFTTESNNVVFAGPSSGGAGLPTFRALVGADLPTPASTTLGGIKSLTCGTGQFLNSISTSGGASCATPTGGGGSNYGMGNGTTVIDASLYAGSDFSAKVNAAIGALSSSGGTVDARGLGGTQTMGSSIVIGSDLKPVTLILPAGTITRATGARFKYFTNTRVIGQGVYPLSNQTATTIVGSGTADTAFAYGGTGQPNAVRLKDFALVDKAYGSGVTSGSIAIDFTLAQSSRIDDVFVYSDTPLLVGGTGTCACYNEFRGNDFRGGTYGVKLLDTANQNNFYGGTAWGTTSVLIRGFTASSNNAVANHFHGVDVENSGTGFDIYGESNVIEDGYFEAVTHGVVLESGARGNTLRDNLGLVTDGILIQDLSGNYSNWYGGAGDTGNGTQAGNPARLGFNDRIIIGSKGIDDCYTGANNGFCYSQFYDVQNLVPATQNPASGLALNFRGASNLYGYYGYAPLVGGVLSATGGESVTGQFSVSALGQPAPPTLACTGSGSGISYTYFIVGNGALGGKTIPSGAATIHCPNPPSSTNPITITPASNTPGVYSWDVLKANTSTSLCLGVKFGAYTSNCSDTGQSTSAYTAPSRDSTGDSTFGGRLATAHSTLDDASGNATFAGQVTSNAGFCIGSNCVTSLTQGTVTSVGLSLPSIFSVTGSPVTTSGTLAATLAAQGANTVFGNCTSSSGTPAFCTLTGAMLPAPTATTLGGVESIAQTPHQWVQYIDTSGVPYQAAISTGDLPAHLANITNAWCYGALGSTNGAYYFGGFGGVQTACGSLTTTLTGGMPLSTAGTVKNLRCAAGAAGHGSSSGVVQVYDNGASQSLTCTLGTGTGCSDSTDSFTYSTGDLLQFSVASGGSGETLANVSCSAEVWVSGN